VAVTVAQEWVVGHDEREQTLKTSLLVELDGFETPQ